MTNTERAEALLRVVTDLSAMRTNGADMSALCRLLKLVDVRARRWGARWVVTLVGAPLDGDTHVDVSVQGDGASYGDAMSSALDNFASQIMVSVQYRLDWAEEAGEVAA